MGPLALSWSNHRWEITLLTDVSDCTPVGGCVSSFNLFDPFLPLLLPNLSGSLALKTVFRPLWYGLAPISLSTLLVFRRFLDPRHTGGEEIQKTVLRCKLLPNFRHLFTSCGEWLLLRDLFSVHFIQLVVNSTVLASMVFCPVSNMLWLGPGLGLGRTILITIMPIILLTNHQHKYAMLLLIFFNWLRTMMLSTGQS